MTHNAPRLLFAASSVLAIAGCTAPTDTSSAAPSARIAGIHQPGVHRQYGRPQKIGDGMVRTYVVLDQKSGGTPLEVGVAMSETVMEGLPAPVPIAGDDHMGHTMANMHMLLLDMPAKNPTPYKFVQFDWNPIGHEPEGVYNVPHFDFHFYTVDPSVRESILPSDPAYAAKAANFPAEEFRAEHYIVPAPPGVPPVALAVPQMGIHWSDARSPELQRALGNPAGFQPFTKTFIFGSWDGQFIFAEPMITRAYLLAKRTATNPAVRDEIIPVPVPASHKIDGFYPSAYRITYDAQAKEYRIALTQLSWQD